MDPDSRHSGPVNFDDLAEVLDSAWTLTCSVLVLLLQPGFALVETGCVQEGNLTGTLAQHLLVLMVGAFAWTLFGSTVAFKKGHVEVSAADEEQARSLFGLLLCLTTVTIALRGLAERAKVWADIAVALAVSVIFYPVVMRWTWGGGWLEDLSPPFHSGAGGAELHLVGGVAAVVGARLAGQRQEPQTSSSKRRRKRPAEERVSQHKAPAVVLGTLLIWVGWYGFAGACVGGMRTKKQALTAARVAVNTTLAAVSGGLFSLLVRAGVPQSIYRRVLALASVHSDVRPSKAVTCLDPLACCFGALAGLVAIAGGSDCVENSAAVAIGALGSAAGLLGSRLLQALRVDDPMQAGAVHGCAGAAGVAAVGLFHRRDGLFAGGGWALLGSQLIGILAIGSFTGGSSFLLFKVLRLLGVVGPQKQRQREELSVDAIQELLSILDRNNLRIEDTINALVKLQGVIWRPFSPQAGNNKIEGEVLDVLNLMSAEVRGDDEYLAFISHYKAEAGDAARIIYDRITSTVLSCLGLGDDSPRTRSPVRSGTRNFNLSLSQQAVIGRDRVVRLPSETEVMVPMQSISSRPKESSCESESDTMTQQNSVPIRDSIATEPRLQTITSEALLPVNHIGVANGGGGRSSVESVGVWGGPASSMSTTSTGDCIVDGMSPSIMNLRALITGAGSVDGPQLDSERLLFLDSVELRDLDDLLKCVRRSSNFIILLTKGVLTRPWVLAEITVALAELRNIVAVRVEWPNKDDEKHFMFPDCIEEVVQQLELCKAEMRMQSPWARRGLRKAASKLSLRGSKGRAHHGAPRASSRQVVPDSPLASVSTRTPSGSSKQPGPDGFGLGVSPAQPFSGLVPDPDSPVNSPQKPATATASSQEDLGSGPEYVY